MDEEQIERPAVRGGRARAPAGPPATSAVASRIRASSVTRALDILGDRWTLLVLRDAFLGVTRFEELRRSTGASRATLSSRLRRLVRHGLLERDPEPAAHGRHEYRLTRKGRDLYPVALMIWRWERSFRPRGARVPGRLIHRRCRHTLLPEMRCRACTGEVRLRGTSYRDGPGASQALREAAAGGERSRRARGAPGGRVLLAHAIDLLGDRWSAQLISAAFLGLHRFDAIRRELGIATNILSHRLAHLVAHGVLQRSSLSTKPARYAYRLTAKGEALFPFTVALLQWGDRWLSARGREPLVLVHGACGQRLHAVAVCGHCGEPLEPHDVLFAKEQP